MRSQPAAAEVETIDLHQIHRPDPDADIEETWTTMEKLREEGKCAGSESKFHAAMERCRPIARIAVLQPPYSAISPEIESEILPYCQRNDIGVIAYSPMKSGLLTGKMTRERVANFAPDDFRRNALAFREPHLGRNLEMAELMKRIGARHGRSAGEVAIAWTLRTGRSRGRSRNALGRAGPRSVGRDGVPVRRREVCRHRRLPRAVVGHASACPVMLGRRTLFGRFWAS